MPRTEKLLHSETVIASGDIGALKLVKHNGAQATVQGEKVLGPARNDAKNGEAVAVGAIGIAIVSAGGTIKVGEDVIANSTGDAIKHPGSGTPYVVGVARSDGSSGGSVEVLLK